jgi:hypothetical protein
MDNKIRGREDETTRLQSIAQEPFAKIIVVYGRRRVGKTTLIHHAFGNRNLLKIEGIENKRERFQRENFLDQLAEQVGDKNISKIKTKNWRETFLVVNKYLEDKEVTLYLEEIQWMADYKDNLVTDLKYVWDNFWQKNNKLILILCGSSPSFLINKVMKSSALYNRSQYEFPVNELSIHAAHQILGPEKSFGEVLDAYLLAGGIPEYLKYLSTESSVYLSLLSNAVRQGGYFTNEAERVFVSSLAKNENYHKVIEILGKYGSKNKNELQTKGKFSAGGTNTKIFNDLILCGFIGRYSPLKYQISKRDEKYFISDYYLMFYYKFIKPNLEKILRGDYTKAPQECISYDHYRQHLGYTLEKYCLTFQRKIAEILGFSSVKYDVGPYYVKEELGQGLQIDLMYKRKDKVLTICEIKYKEQKIGLDVVTEVDEKISRLSIHNTFKNFSIDRVLIAPNGVTADLLAKGYFSKIIQMKDIFS